LMGAATILAWYFMMAPMYMQSTLPLIGKITGLAFPVADLGVLFILVVLFTHAKRPQTGRVALGLLIVAFILLIIGDFWFAILSLSSGYKPGDPPDFFWIICYLLFPLAALAQYRLVRRIPPPPPAARVWLGIRREDFMEGFRFLLPFAVALAAAAAIEFQAMQAPQTIPNRLATHLLVFALLLLVLLRQQVVYVEHLRLRREKEQAQSNELTLREANRQMEAFLGMASHELKTPLTTIIMGLQMIPRRAEKMIYQGLSVSIEAFHPTLTMLFQQAQRLDRLVNDLLDISRIQAGRLELHPEPADLAAIVRAMVAEQRAMFPQRTIRLDLLEGEHVPVMADAGRVGQVVTNYLTNALKYSAEDSPVDVGMQIAPTRARVWVRDQGPGLPPAEQARIWERFHRVPGVEVQSGTGIGLGLGLHISKTIIEQHGGRVGVQSTPGQGSTFWFTLPLAGGAGAC
jgi:signal transduction histidine kinase